MLALPQAQVLPAATRCPAPTQVQLVRSLVAAFNAGNSRAVNRLVAPEPAFQWFSAIGPDSRIGKKAWERALELYEPSKDPPCARRPAACETSSGASRP